MARKTIVIPIEAANRDHGKKFFIREMAASRAERWALRALNGAAQSGVEIPENVRELGMGGIAAMGIKAFFGLPWEIADPLMAEMFAQITIVSEAGVQANPDEVKTRDLLEEDIEEIATRLMLRREVIKLHIDFSMAAAALTKSPTQAVAEPASA